MKFYKTATQESPILAYEINGIPFVDYAIRPKCNKEHYIIHMFDGWGVVWSKEVPTDAVEMDALEETTEYIGSKRHFKDVVKSHLDWWQKSPQCAPKEMEYNP